MEPKVILNKLTCYCKDLRSKSDYILTIITELIVVVSTFITLKLASNSFSPQEFGEFSIIRRVMSIIGIPMLMGLGLSLPKLISSKFPKSTNSDNPLRYLITSFIFLFPLLMMMILIVFYNQKVLSLFFFGSANCAYNFIAIILLCIGLQLHSLIYGYYRGLMLFKQANLFRLISFFILPPICVIFFNSSVLTSFIYLGIFWILLYTITFINLITGNFHTLNLNRSYIFDDCHFYLKYGIPRIPGEFALFGLLSLPVFIITRKNGLIEAGLLSFLLSIFQACASLFASIGIVLFPKISEMHSNHKSEKIINITINCILFAIIMSSLIVFAITINLEHIIIIGIGKSFALNIVDSRILFYALPPYAVFLMLRNTLDAISPFPFNSINLIITLSTSYCLFSISYTTHSIYISFVTSIFLLFLLTVICCLTLLATNRDKHLKES